MSGIIGTPNHDLIFSSTNIVQPSQWEPSLVLPAEYGSTKLSLSTLEILPLRPGLQFSLEPCYIVEKMLPRSYFNILQQCSIGHTFVFSWPKPDHIFFQEMAGMRKSTFVRVTETNSREKWELHLKPSKERTYIFGYLCKPEDIKKFVQSGAEAMLRSRKIPLVLDLDDTLVRIVGNIPKRNVSQSDADLVPARVRELKDGRRVVVTDRVNEFLEWASKLFDISVCSLGDQPYVDMVVQALDPARNIIRGILYSARAEYVYITQTSTPKRPPKDLKSLFAFCAIGDESIPVIDPLIIDDNIGMWPQDQQDNIIVVRENTRSDIWSVSLYPIVRDVLENIHQSFFKQLDQWAVADKLTRGPPPSALNSYKDYLRKQLAIQIANTTDNPTSIAQSLLFQT